MTNETLFSVTGNTFILAWLSLLVGMFLRPGAPRSALLVLGGRFIPVALLMVFITGVFLHRDIEPQGDLFTYQGMLLLLSVPERLMNVWVEVLAYALFACRWVIDDAERREISKAPVLVCLLVAFISGGMGLLTYAVVVGVRQFVKNQVRTPSQRPTS